MKSTTILLVEDNPDDVELTLRTLRKHRVVHEVLVARDGEEAWRLTQAGPLPDFVLLDLNLPKMSGLELLQQWRADDRTRTLPVIVLTASKEDQDFLEGASLGVDAYIRKPVDVAQVGCALRQLGLHGLLSNHNAAT